MGRQHGVGVRTAPGILLEVGDVAAFPTFGHLAAYAGLAPVTRPGPGRLGRILDLVGRMRGRRIFILQPHPPDVQRVAVGVLRAGRLLCQGSTRVVQQTRSR